MAKVVSRGQKNRLARKIREVRSRRAVVAADRGTIAAEIVLPEENSARTAAGLAALAAKGEVTLGAPNDPSAYPKLPRLMRRRSSSELLDEERGER